MLLKHVMTALVAVLASSCLMAAQSDDALTSTSVLRASASSIRSTAVKHRCHAEQEDEGRVYYEGKCFAFPGEISSEFDIAPDGRLMKATICLSDELWLASLWGSLSKLFGHPQALGKGHDAFFWIVGEETWTFVPSSENRWLFSRTRTTDAQLAEYRKALKAHSAF